MPWASRLRRGRHGWRFGGCRQCRAGRFGTRRAPSRHALYPFAGLGHAAGILGEQEINAGPVKPDNVEKWTLSHVLVNDPLWKVFRGLRIRAPTDPLGRSDALGHVGLSLQVSLTAVFLQPSLVFHWALCWRSRNSGDDLF